MSDDYNDNDCQDNQRLITRAEHAYQQIQSAIVRGEIAAGSKIIETDLAKTYGISRGPLREAIHRLEAQKLLERTAHVGTRVVCLSLAELNELYQIRANLESLACKLTAEKQDPAVIDELHDILRLHANDENLQQNTDYYPQSLDDDFHYCIIKNSGNTLLAKLLCDELYHLIKMHRIRFARTQGRPKQALEEHRQILSAIACGDGQLAQMLMQRHIMASYQNIREHFAKQSTQHHNQTNQQECL
ncbi:GntR family transcriptional regulator [Moraxella cuniculi]|nr:GntR family transcriptional regulator [Moraxella cuniculi]